MTSSFFRGTSKDQTSYFADKESKMLSEYIWPKSFDEKVDLSKVSMDMVKSWLCQKVTDLTGKEDEILIEFILNSLLDSSIDPKTLTVRLTGFLGDGAFDFMASLWKLLLGAQQNQIPDELKQAQNKEEEAQRLEAENIKRELAELNRNKSPPRRSSEYSPSRRPYSPSPGIKRRRRRSVSPSQSPPPRRRQYSRSPPPYRGRPPAGRRYPPPHRHNKRHLDDHSPPRGRPPFRRSEGQYSPSPGYRRNYRRYSRSPSPYYPERKHSDESSRSQSPYRPRRRHDDEDSSLSPRRHAERKPYRSSREYKEPPRQSRDDGPKERNDSPTERATNCDPEHTSKTDIDQTEDLRSTAAPPTSSQSGGRFCYMDDVRETGRVPLWLSSQQTPVKRSTSEERLRALALQTLRRR